MANNQSLSSVVLLSGRSAMSYPALALANKVCNMQTQSTALRHLCSSKRPCTEGRPPHPSTPSALKKNKTNKQTTNQYTHLCAQEGEHLGRGEGRVLLKQPLSRHALAACGKVNGRMQGR